MVSIILRHYIFCLIGAGVRFIYLNIYNLLKNRKRTYFKEVWNYKNSTENEISDAIIGFLVLGMSLTIILG
ncbi:MAG: hypothetical protein ABR84_03450 [Cryomorphaceae bacterium BACL21 MAG-121220-bin10]|jgi:hypothetical protein|nr:MAG: hypothetical protein ABR84_03450 [Cryomorphaceae bacterium BACL21 MAG-121220-bin10]